MLGRGERGGRGGGRGRGRLAPGLRPVEESTRIDIAETLAAFQASDESEYTFPPGLNNHDRAVVHAECKKYGFTSKSAGKDASRVVTVFKRRAAPQHDAVFELPLGPASLASLASHFARHPPTEAELAEAAGEGHIVELDAAYGSGTAGSSEEEDNGGAAAAAEGGGCAEGHTAAGGTNGARAAGAGRRDDRGPHAAEFSAEEVARRRMRWEQRIARPDVQPIIAARAALPIAAHREEIVAAMERHQVVLIAGETGCGKTTQVPQFILEDAWLQGKGCRVVCTQPRRISAISVAERVASERGESAGENVGYTIRLESRGGPDASLLFCTNGVLLRMLTGADDALRRVTHLVVDEIHERDRFADFLLILVRDLLPAHPRLRVVLMSATLHVDLFSGYFGGCPVVRVPGFTHPVQDFYLEDVLRLTGYQEAAVKEVERALGTPGGAASIVRGLPAGGKGSGGGPLSGGALPPEQRVAVEAAIEAAFKTGGDAEFDALMEVTGAAGYEDAGGGAPGVNVRHPATGATALIAASFRGRADVVSVLLANGADPGVEAHNGMTAAACAAQCGHRDVVEALEEWAQQAAAADELANAALALSHYQCNQDADEVDVDLVEALLMYICGEGAFAGGRHGGGSGGAPPGGGALGAVLIFLPGWDEIIRLKEKLERSPCFGASQRYQLLPLHSMVAPAEQRRVFVRPPRGVRKMVLATNIAETAITIDDVVCVVDSGRLKEKSYDPYTGVATLQATWISKASERQRRGRAGRCQPGVAFHMYSRARSEALAEFQSPEIKRTPLDEMCLQVKLLESPGRRVRIPDFLAKAVEPPLAPAVDAALRLLCDIGALDSRERLTSLGRHLAALPLPPALGKLLLYGVMYRCLDPVLTVACCMAYRDPWVLPAAADARREASLLRSRLSSEAGGSSDQLATVRAYNGWKAARAAGGDRGYCARHFLSPATMAMVDGMRGQLLAELTGRGFARSLEEASTDAHRADLVRAVLACGFYPFVGRVLPVPARDAKAKCQVLTRKGERVRIHPASVNARLRIERREEDDFGEGGGAPERAALLFFDEVTRNEAFLYVKSCTAIHPHPLLFVAASLLIAHDPGGEGGVAERVQSMRLGGGNGGGERGLDGGAGQHAGREGAEGAPESSLLVVDGWLKFRVPFAAVAQFMCLRLRLAAAFAATVRHPRRRLPPALQGALEVSAALFLSESESADGRETRLGASFDADAASWQRPRPPPGLGGGGRAARFGGGGPVHLFRYSHEGSYPPQRGAPQATQRAHGRLATGVFDPDGQSRSGRFGGEPFRGGQPQWADDEDRAGGVKRSHSGTPVMGGGGGRGRGRALGGGGSGGRGGRVGGAGRGGRGDGGGGRRGGRGGAGGRY